MSFPLIFENVNACAQLRGRNVTVPTIAATALILASRGGDQLLVPCPSDRELERAEAGIELLPKERRACIKIVDRKGTVLQTVREYLHPLVAQAREWPEDAFVASAEAFVYQIALGSKYRSGILDDSVESVREFVPIIRPNRFRGETRFRLAEVISLVCSYEPHHLEHFSLPIETPIDSSFSTHIWSLMDKAQFRAITSVSGRLGYLRHPLVGVKRLQQVIRGFIGNQSAKRILSLATTAAELAGAGAAAKSTESIFNALTMSLTDFRPPFMSLGPAILGVYRDALANWNPDATPPSGTIMLFEHSRAGRASHSWLNVGEENKLERESNQPERLKKRFLAAKAAQEHFPI